LTGGVFLNQRFERNLKKGVLEMLVLKLLEEEEKYGYQLICELKERSDELFAMKEGTLYPILYRLEDEGLVINRWSEARGREVSRKYYSITEAGRKNLEEMRQLWKQFFEQVNIILED